MITKIQHFSFWMSLNVNEFLFLFFRPPSLVVADFGCGDCKIARSVKNKVHSFDLAPVCDLATACDMAKVSYYSSKTLICNAAKILKAALFIAFSQVPLRDSTVDIVVFCLSLMGTNLGQFLAEANRVLVMG